MHSFASIEVLLPGMRGLILQIIIGIAGLWLAVKFVPEIAFTGPIYFIPGPGLDLKTALSALVSVGAILGFLNFFIKPILKTITLPLRIITLNLFTLVISMALVWVVDIFSPELIIKGIASLFWTALILWGLNLVVPRFFAPKLASS